MEKIQLKFEDITLEVTKKTEEKYQKIINNFVKLYSDRYIRVCNKLITENGRVFSLVTNKFLSLSKTDKPKISFIKNKRKKYYIIDILVATYFVPNPNPETKNVVWHKNGIMSDNSYLNLIWTTEQEFKDLRTKLFLEKYLKNNTNLQYKEHFVNNNYIIFNNGTVFSKFTCDFLSNTTHDDGYLMVSFYFPLTNKYIRYTVHRMVAELFIENPYPNKYDQVDHINRIKTDNRVENLRWVDRSQNMFNIDQTNLFRRAILQINIETNEIIKRFASVKDAKKVIKGYKNIDGKYESKIDDETYLWIYEIPEVKIKSIPEGFYELDQFPEYLISKNGQIYSTKTYKIMKFYKNTNGYLLAYLRNKSYSVHRLVLNKFNLNKPENYEKMVVNHINGNKEDNRLENLEYITMSENTKHSHNILGKGVIRIKCYDTHTGEILKFKNKNEAAIFLKMAPYTIKKYMKDTCGDKLFRNRYQFELDTDPFIINIEEYNNNKCLSN